MNTVLGAEPGAVVYGVFFFALPMFYPSILFVVRRDRLLFSRHLLHLHGTDSLLRTRHSGTWKTGRRETDVSYGPRVRRRGCLYRLQPEADAEGSVRADEQRYSDVWSHLGFVICTLLP